MSANICSAGWNGSQVSARDRREDSETFLYARIQVFHLYKGIVREILGFFNRSDLSL